jgi:8-oxo-dGTP diphosphatase
MIGVAGIVLKGDLVLLVRRGVEPRKGYGAFPGGYAKVGETTRHAVRREVLEEAGVDSEILGVIDICEFPPYGTSTYITFLSKHVRGDPRPGSDAAEARWFTFNEAQELGSVTSLTKLLVSKVAKRDYNLIQAHTIEDVHRAKG